MIFFFDVWCYYEEVLFTYNLNNLVRFVPAPGLKDKVVIVPMMHLRLFNPQGCSEEKPPTYGQGYRKYYIVYIYIYTWGTTILYIWIRRIRAFE